MENVAYFIATMTNKEAQVQFYSPGGANVLSWEGTSAPSGEYD